MWLWVKTKWYRFWGRCTTHFRTYFSGWIGMSTGGTIWILTHGHVLAQLAQRKPSSVGYLSSQIWGGGTGGVRRLSEAQDHDIHKSSLSPKPTAYQRLENLRDQLHLHSIPCHCIENPSSEMTLGEAASPSDIVAHPFHRPTFPILRGLPLQEAHPKKKQNQKPPHLLPSGRRFRRVERGKPSRSDRRPCGWCSASRSSWHTWGSLWHAQRETCRTCFFLFLRFLPFFVPFFPPQRKPD